MKKLLKEFALFRLNCGFTYLPVEEKDGCKYFCGQLVEDDKKKYSEGEGFLNVGYSFKNSPARVLSNLYPMQFRFRGQKVNSIEGVLQSLKYKDKKTQKLVWKYSGLDAYHTRGCNEIDLWTDKCVLYWQVKAMDRQGEEYQTFLDELYLSVAKNPLYRRALLATGDKYLLHHFGCEDKSKTVLTRFEYESRMFAVREFIKQKDREF